MKFSSLLVALSVLVPFMPHAAHADYFVWADEKTGLTASFPDTWKIIANTQPDDVLHVALPSGADRAECFIRVDADKRFVIYPNRYRKDVQKVAYSRDFWKEYNATYQNVKELGFGDETGLGKGFASTEMITYTTPPDEPFENRAAILSVTNYFDKTYIAGCSSTQASYSKYATSFLSFMKTIDQQKAYHELTIGNHPRNFINEGTLEFKSPNGVSTERY